MSTHTNASTQAAAVARTGPHLGQVGHGLMAVIVVVQLATELLTVLIVMVSTTASASRHAMRGHAIAGQGWKRYDVAIAVVVQILVGVGV